MQKDIWTVKPNNFAMIPSISIPAMTIKDMIEIIDSDIERLQNQPKKNWLIEIRKAYQETDKAKN